MRTASAIFDESSRTRINEAVREAEARCGAQIVPVVATQSGRYDRAEDFAGWTLGLFAMSAAWLLFQRAETGDWGGATLALELPALLIILLGGFVAGAILAMRIKWMRRLFTLRRHMEEEVARRAREVFFDRRVHHTRAETGLLIYVSLYEDLALLLADRSVFNVLGEKGLNELREMLVQQLRKQSRAEAICAVIAQAARRLEADLPPRADAASDELPDALVIIE